MDNNARGQIFSIDFLIAVSVLTLAMAIALQTSDLMQKRGTQFAQSQDSLSEAIAQQFVSKAPGFSFPDPALIKWCYLYSNSSMGPTSSGCSNLCLAAGNIFVAKRLVACGSTACSLEVRVCA